MSKVIELKEFQNEVKKLVKKYASLYDDIEILKQVLEVEQNGIPGKIFEIPGLKLTNSKAYKVKKFRCKSLGKSKSDSGIRVVYGFKSLAPETIYLIEIYYKGDRENEDRERIKKYLD